MKFCKWWSSVGWMAVWVVGRMVVWVVVRMWLSGGEGGDEGDGEDIEAYLCFWSYSLGCLSGLSRFKI